MWTGTTPMMFKTPFNYFNGANQAMLGAASVGVATRGLLGIISLTRGCDSTVPTILGALLLTVRQCARACISKIKGRR